MRRLFGLALFIVLVALAFAMQGPKEIPECRGEGCRDDVTKQMHPGAPAWCQNKDGEGWAANCDCKRSCDRNDRGSDCKTYCRTPRCRCDHGCPNTR